MQGKCPQCHRPWHHLDGFIVSSHAHTLMSMPQLVFVRTYQNRPPTPSWTVFKHKSSEWFKIHICLFILFPGWESKTLEPCCAQKSRSLGSSCPMPILCYSDLCVKVSFSVTLSPLEWDFYRSLSACIQNQKQLWNQTLFTHRKKNSGRSSKCWEILKTTTTKHFYLSSCVSFFFFPPDLRFPSHWPSCVGAEFHMGFHGSEGQMSGLTWLLADSWSLWLSRFRVLGITSLFAAVLLWFFKRVLNSVGIQEKYKALQT